MNVRQLRFASWIAAAALAIGAATIIGAALWLPYDDAIASPETTSSTVVRVQVRAAERVAIEDFEPYLARGLRLPVAEAPAPSPAAEVVEAAPPSEPVPAMQLVGTVTENGNSYAVFQMPDGTVEMKRTGETVGGAEIVEIREGVAVMRALGEGQATTTTLRVPLPPG